MADYNKNDIYREAYKQVKDSPVVSEEHMLTDDEVKQLEKQEARRAFKRKVSKVGDVFKTDFKNVTPEEIRAYNRQAKMINRGGQALLLPYVPGMYENARERGHGKVYSALDAILALMNPVFTISANAALNTPTSRGTMDILSGKEVTY